MIGARATLVLLLVTAGALPAAAQAPDAFYSELERSGRAALARGERAEAARLMRIACFGLLEVPERLGACLVRLGLAQESAGDGAGFDQTFRRLQTVEERFTVWERLAIDPAERAAYGKIAGERIPAALLRSQAAFAPFAPAAPAAGKSSKPAKSAERSKAPAPSVAPAAKSEPKSRSKAESKPQPKPEPAAPPPAPEPPRSAPAVPTESVPSAPTEWTAAERETLSRVRTLLAGPAGIDAIDAALAEVRPVADRHPDDVEAQRTVAVLAYRASRWEICAEAFRRAGLPPAEQPLTRFYMAVCLYETGDRSGAADVVRDSAPQLKRTDFVDRYLRVILGPDAVKP